MGETGYKRYLSEHGKIELSCTYVPVPNPAASQWRLEELLVDPWTWLILPNNRAHFVEDVLQAGGSHAGLYSNCPSKEVFR